MKKLLYILLFVPLALFGQSTAYIEQDVPLELSEGWNMFGYSCYEPIDVAIAFTSIEDKIVIVKDNSGNVYIPEFGFNGIGSLERNLGYQIKLTESISDFQFCPFIVPISSVFCDCCGGFNLSEECEEFCALIEINCDEIVIFGCTQEWADNYDDLATIDDGSCYNLGCIDSLACNFNPESNMADGSCEYPNPGYDCFGNDLENCYSPDFNSVFWLNEYYPQLMNEDCLIINSAENYSELEIFGDELDSIPWINLFTNLTVLEIDVSGFSSLPDISGLSNLNELYISGLSNLPDLSGLTNLNYLQISNNVSLTSIPDLSGLINLNFLDIHSNISLTSLPDLSSLINLNDLSIDYNDGLTSIPDLSGLTNLNYLRISNSDSLTSLPDLSELINLNNLTIENLSSLSSLPDLSELINLNNLTINNLSSLTSLLDLSNLTNLNDLSINYNDGLTSIPGLSELYNLESLCVSQNNGLTILPDLSELANLSELLVGSDPIFECVLVGYPEQLTIQEHWPPVCEEEVTYQVGDLAEGGIVFYVDETGEHGLVAAMEDLTEGATIDSEGNPGYQWGCFAMWLSGADEQAIGTGYQNTLDIASGCSETPIAASAALEYESENYSDWFLPSLDELKEMYNTIGNGGSEGDIGGFSSNWYWSSSESNNYGAYDVYFGDGSTGNFSSKTKIVRVRPIRSF